MADATSNTLTVNTDIWFFEKLGHYTTSFKVVDGCEDSKYGMEFWCECGKCGKLGYVCFPPYIDAARKGDQNRTTKAYGLVCEFRITGPLMKGCDCAKSS